MLRVYRITTGGIAEVSTPNIESLLKSGEKLLVDIIGPNEEHVALMRDVFHFHPLAIEDTQNERQRPKVEEYGSHLFTILNLVELQGHEVEFRELDLFLGEQYVVIVHEKEEDLLRRLIYRCNMHAYGSIPLTVGFVMYALLDLVVDSYFPVLDELGEEIDRLSESVLSNPRQEFLQRLFHIRHTLNEIWHISGQQRDMFSVVTRENSIIVRDDALRYYLRDVYDHLLRIYDIANMFRDTLTNVVELYMSSFSNRLNVTVKRLTMMTIAIGVLTVISGFYGMNFERTWPAFNSPAGVPIVMFIMLAALGLVLYFVRRLE